MCQQCQIVHINGVKCHEQGCPDAWMDYTRDCKYCGCNFKPESKSQDICSQECADAYWGMFDSFFSNIESVKAE